MGGNNNLHRTVHKIKDLGKKARVVINPATPAAVLEEILPDLDLVVVMTVNPGFGHQHFLLSTLPKIGRVRRMIENLHINCEVEVDGGIDEKTAALAATAGANVFVAGSSIFGAGDGITAAMDRLRDAFPPYSSQEIGESEGWNAASRETEVTEQRAGKL